MCLKAGKDSNLKIADSSSLRFDTLDFQPLCLAHIHALGRAVLSKGHIPPGRRVALEDPDVLRVLAEEHGADPLGRLTLHRRGHMAIEVREERRVGMP
jgi:hypothetical protein